MSFFKNTVVITEVTRVITNPQNYLVVGSHTAQSGKKYYTQKTVWNFIKHVLRKTFSYLQWRKISH